MGSVRSSLAKLRGWRPIGAPGPVHWRMATVAASAGLLGMLAQSALAGPLALGEMRAGANQGVLARISTAADGPHTTTSAEFTDIPGASTEIETEGSTLVIVRFSALSACVGTQPDKDVRPSCEVEIFIEGSPIHQSGHEFDAEDDHQKIGFERHEVERFLRIEGGGEHRICVGWRVQQAPPRTDCGPQPGDGPELAPCAPGSDHSWGLEFTITEWQMIIEKYRVF